MKISQDFINCVTEAFSGYDFKHYNTEAAKYHVLQIYEKFKSANGLFEEIETEADQLKRIQYEIVDSKKSIESHLNIPVEFLCWPHGDNNDEVHRVALQAGYLATTSGSKHSHHDHPDRIPSRIGMHPVYNNRFLTLLKLKYKTGSVQKRFPYSQINSFYNMVKYGRPVI